MYIDISLSERKATFAAHFVWFPVLYAKGGTEVMNGTSLWLC